MPVASATDAVLLDALAAFFRASRRARGRAARRVDDGELSLAQWHLVEPLLEGALPGGRLAEIAEVSAPTASRMIDVLVGRGYLERIADSADRRVVRLALTEAGQAAAERKAAHLADARARLVAALDPADRETAARVLVRLADVVEEL